MVLPRPRFAAFVAFLTLYLRLIWPIISLGWLLAVTEEAASASQRIFDVLDTSPSIADPPRPKARSLSRRRLLTACCSD